MKGGLRIADILLNGVYGRRMTFSGVGTQDVEEIRKFGHCNSLIGFLVAEVIPMIAAGAAITTYHFDIVLCQGEPGSEQLWQKVSAFIINQGHINENL